MHIDPKAPATSPAHPRNWRQPLFLPPGVVTHHDFVSAVADQPPAGGTPVADAPKKAPAKRPAGKKVTHKAAKPALAEALAALDDQ